MDRMRLAFYKAFQSKGTMLDKTIAVASLGRFSHVEMVFPDGKCFSISPRENVVRFKNIELDPKQWELIDLKPTLDIDKIYEKINDFDKYKYDYFGAIFSITPLCLQLKNKVFCSELVTDVLRAQAPYYFLREGCKYSPNELYELISTDNRCTNIK